MTTKPSYDDIDSTGQVQLLHNWKLNIIQFPAKGTYPDPEALNWRCTTTDIPTASTPKASIVARGHELHYPSGIVKYKGSITLNFFEDDTGTIREFIRQWREVCSQTRTQKGSKKADAKAIIELVLTDVEDTDNWRFQLYGCFHEDSNLGSLGNGSNPEVMNPSITLSYDIFEDEKVS